MTLAVRLKQARLRKKLTQEELAETVGIKQQAVQRIEAGKVKSTSYVVQLAKCLGVTPEWLALGEEESTTLAHGNIPDSDSHHSNSAFSLAPILQWHDIELIQQLPLLHQHLKTLPVFTTSNDQCFALQIKDNSMVSQNSGEISFLKEDYIIIDSSLTAKYDDYIIAKLPASTQMTFRQLQFDGTERHLKALNSQYNTIRFNEDIHICGVVISRYSTICS